VVASDPSPAATPAGAPAAATDSALQLALDVVKAAAILQPGASEPSGPTRIETSAPRCPASPA
jgi:hypothetical protein